MLKKTKKKVINFFNKFRVSRKEKIFCIGLNKTGTTSLKKEMELQGYIVGNQRDAELLFDDWVKRDFHRIINYCNTADFFQDAPFSFPYTFIAIDQAFPRSKFILTVRDNAEQWYESLIRFHGKLWGNGNIPPTSENLKNADYIYKGFPYHSRIRINNVPENEPYKKDILINYYKMHNENVIDYFRHRKNDLLVINIKEKEDYGNFCKFINSKQERDAFPWENKT